MKSYRTFIILFLAVLTLYIVAEVNRPQPVNWNVTLSKDDKNPFGSYILYDRLKDMFPYSSIVSLRQPVYNLLHNEEIRDAAYILLAPVSPDSKTDLKELVKFAERGNYVFVSAQVFSGMLTDTLGLKLEYAVNPWSKDSTSLNFVNPALRADTNYRFRKLMVDSYFSALEKKDSTTVLGISGKNQPNFIKIRIGAGAFLVHAAPLCFSNYFMLFNNNHEYVSRALSYIPVETSTIYWDEYYKLGRSGPSTPLRYFLGNEWLRWALRLAIIGFILYAFVEMKRRQRVIPVIEPLRNTTLDFVKTVAAVYLTQKDNRSIAHNKIQYWMQHVRQYYYLPTNELNDEFVKALSKKSGVEEPELQQLLSLIVEIQGSNQVTDVMLLELNRRIEQFYTLSKS